MPANDPGSSADWGLSEGALSAAGARMRLMAEAERKVARYVLLEPRKALLCGVSELAARSGASRTAVVRFCKSIGCKGYAEFRLRLARDIFDAEGDRELAAGDGAGRNDVEERIRATIGAAEEGLRRLSSSLVPSLVDEAARTITESPAVAIFGIGALGVVAYGLYQGLMAIGVPASLHNESGLPLAKAGSLREGETALLVASAEDAGKMDDIVALARSRGAQIIALTDSEPGGRPPWASALILAPAAPGAGEAERTSIGMFTLIDILIAATASKKREPLAAETPDSDPARHRAREQWRD